MKIEIIKSKRKSVSIEVKPDLSVIVRAPLGMSNKAIEGFIVEKQNWINKSIDKMKARTTAEATEPKFTESEISQLKKDAKLIIPSRVEYFAKIIGVSYDKIFIRHQVTRWGSCSSLKNLNFNCLLSLCPDEVINYVIIHELCHLIEPNHSKRFWTQVEKYCPDYKIYKKWLNTEGIKLIKKIKKTV